MQDNENTNSIPDFIIKFAKRLKNPARELKRIFLYSVSM